MAENTNVQTIQGNVSINPSSIEMTPMQSGENVMANEPSSMTPPVEGQNATAIPVSQGPIVQPQNMSMILPVGNQSNNPELILKSLIPGALYELNGCLLIYKNSTSTMQSVMKNITKSQNQEHDFFFIGHDGTIQSAESTPYVNLPRNFFNQKNIKSLVNLSLNPVEATKKMVFSPFFGYKFGRPKELAKVYGGIKEYYYIDPMGTPHALKVLPPPPTIPQNSVFFHATQNRKGPSAKGIKNGKYEGNDLKTWAATRGGRKSKKNYKKYNSRTMKK